jgi:pSer/pThr/pTyr-binding forkhead associated (FHA) protein
VAWASSKRLSVSPPANPCINPHLNPWVSKRQENTITIERDSTAAEYTEPIITIGRLEGNRIQFFDHHVSRRHRAIVNYRDDVWIYDLGSTYGVFVDGNKVDRKAYLEGVHAVVLGQTELKVRTKSELLV